MSRAAYYVAYQASPRIRANSEKLVRNIESGVASSQADLMTDVMYDFINETLQVFFVDVIEIVEMSPFMEKVMMGSVATIKATVTKISKTIIHKLDNRQLTPLAEHMKSLMLTASDADGRPQPYVGFSIPDELQQRIHDTIVGLRGDTPRAHVQAFTDILYQVTDLALDAYFQTPLDLMKLGFILRKLADGGMEVVHGACHLAIRKVVPDMNDKHLRAVADYMEKLVITDVSTFST